MCNRVGAIYNSPGAMTIHNNTIEPMAQIVNTYKLGYNAVPNTSLTLHQLSPMQICA